MGACKRQNNQLIRSRWDPGDATRGVDLGLLSTELGAKHHLYTVYLGRVGCGGQTR